MTAKLKRILNNIIRSNSNSLPDGIYKMVRHFPNNFKDFKPGDPVNIDKDDLMAQIDAHVNNITKRFLPSHHCVDGGLYVGVTGISYMFYQLSRNPELTANKRTYLEKSYEYLKPALETSAGDKTSFLLGDGGTFAIATVLNKELGSEDYNDYLSAYKSLYNTYLNPNFIKCGADEFFVGRAGYIAGALWVSREIKTPVLAKDQLYNICDVIVASGRDYSSRHRSPCPLMYHYYNTEYLGAAHGVSFILQMLLTVPGYLNYNASAAAYIKETINYLVSLQTAEGNWPCCMEELSLGEHKLVHWCHGAPGTIYLMARAYLVYKDESYLKACINSGEVVWKKGLLYKGPGICHGVAGNGYVFLLLFRLTGDNKYLYRAKVFADFMKSDEFLKDAKVPDNPETLYEGAAGTVCYLADLLNPDMAEFPFQDVFVD